MSRAVVVVVSFVALMTTGQPPAARLAPCPDTPNCVSTEAERASQRVDVVPFTDAPADALRRARAAIEAEPRTMVVDAGDGWLRAESRSFLFRFVDDVDVVIDAEARCFRFRSASRVGRSDLGVNRKRVARIAARLRASDPSR